MTEVKNVAQELDKTPAQAAIAWILSHPEITVAICGADTETQIEDSAGALGWELDDVSKPPAVWS